jgi:early endosome antigen 1
MDDSQAALQELGRENQTLQIQSAKTTTRKWLEDKEAANCLACDKAFSVTVRRVGFSYREI